MRHLMGNFFRATVGAMVSVSAILIGGSLFADETPTTQPAFQPLLNDLDAPLYETRVKASRTLKSLNSQQLAELAKLANKTASAETVVRILAEVDNRYSVPSRATTLVLKKDRPPKNTKAVADMFSASATLESLVSENRDLVAEAAQQSLREHAAKRMDIALQKLQSLGAFIRMGAMPAAGIGMRPTTSGETMQILITKRWAGGNEGLEVFERLNGLFGPPRNLRNLRNVSPIRASLFLIDGHLLSELEESRLAEVVGQTAMQRRSQVALGIVWDSNPMIPVSGGVLIRDVSKGGSAETAGLNRGDLILAIESDEKTAPEPADLLFGRPRSIPGDDALGDDRVPLRDFDDLVTRLKDYGKGDVIKLRVIRGRGAQMYLLRAAGIQLRNPEGKEEETKPEILNVKLKGWEELGREWKFPY